MADWLKGKGRLMSEVRKSDDFATPLEAFLRDAGNGLIDIMRSKIDESNVNASFVMRQGLDIQTSSNQVDFTAESEYTLQRNEGVSGTEVKRDTPFSFKTNRPSYAMVQSIEDWMRAKGFEANPWGVAVNVLKHGYDGARFIQNTFTDENLNSFENALMLLLQNNIDGRMERVSPNFR